MVALLTCFSLTSYIERVNVTVVLRFVRDEFHLTNGGISWAFGAFLIGYTLAQLPSGALVDRYGARPVLVGAAMLWFLFTLALGLMVGRLATNSLQILVCLVMTRLLLGVAEAPTYPGAASIITKWFVPERRGIPNAIIQSTAYAGEAVTMVLMASLTAYLGWRNALLGSAVPALLIACAWWGLGSSAPENDQRIPYGELPRIQQQSPKAKKGKGATQSGLQLLRQRNIIYLSLCYFGHGYIAYLFFFWFYIYLVDARHFSVAAGGIVGALPTVAAALCALAGGPLNDRLVSLMGVVRGRQLLVFFCSLIAAAGVLVGCFSHDPGLAIGGFIVAIGSRGLVESAFWSSVSDLGEAHSGLVGGAMNTMGNIGGLASTLLAPALVLKFGWSLAVASAAAAAMLSGLLILGVKDARSATGK